MIRFLRILKTRTSEENGAPLSECAAAELLDGLRAQEDGFLEPSFRTISAYGENAAVIHYAPDPAHDRQISPSGFLLVDSGGQYLDGTTDITRTIACGPLSEKMKTCYTLVLRSHIALARANCKDGMSGSDLDSLSRAPLRSHGLDFAHGISHGVGHVLSVHEGPNGIRRTQDTLTIEPGTIQSDEPGYYEAGSFGVRIENELLAVPGSGNGECCEAPSAESGGGFSFRTLTLVPYEPDAILPEMLSDEELAWINGYHAAVRRIMSPLLSEADRKFLAEQTRPIQN